MTPNTQHMPEGMGIADGRVADGDRALVSDQAAARLDPAGVDPSRWQPIETAPRDGTWFVAANFGVGEPEYETGCYDPQPWVSYISAGDGLYRRVEEIISDWRGFDNFHRATHWMPLPPPPGAGE